MKVCVLGLGYIGLPTALMFASNNNFVNGVDINENIVNCLNNGQTHIKEPDIIEMLKSVIDTNWFNASTKPSKADVYIICVPTPKNNDYTCNSEHILKALNSILEYLQKGSTVIIESTIGPGIIYDEIVPFFKKYNFKIGIDIFIAYCPERVIPGNVIYEIINNDRIIAGVTPNCCEKACEIYQTFVKGKIYKTTIDVCEMVKLVENTYRDINIAFSNELVKICSNLKTDVYDVIKYANKHPRVNILNPGPGVGGHCLAIDPYFIYSKDKENAQLIKLSRDINCSMPLFVYNKIVDLLTETKNPKIAILGVAYKGNIDDTRESPALKVIKMLKEKEYELCVYDPYVKYDKNITLCHALSGASLVVILSEHDQFKYLNENFIIKHMKNPVIFDTKNIIPKDKYKDVLVYNYGNL